MTDTEGLPAQIAGLQRQVGRVKLFVGYEDPPTEFVGIASTTGGSNAYLGAVIREGEFFLLDAGVSSPRSDASSLRFSDELICATRRAASWPK